jgi:hypothetical protein
VDFLTKYQYRKAEQRIAAADKVEIIQDAIKNKKALKYHLPETQR